MIVRMGRMAIAIVLLITFAAPVRAGDRQRARRALHVVKPPRPPPQPAPETSVRIRELERRIETLRQQVWRQKSRLRALR